MSRRVRIVLGVLLALALAVLSYVLMRPRTPTYQGKSLVFWLEQSIATGRQAANAGDDVEAVREIGADAVPTLVAMARVRDSSPKRRWIKWVRTQKYFSIRVHTEEEDHNMACFGFSALGPAGKDAVPALIKLLRGDNQTVRVGAADCLGNIGPEAGAAVPDLVRLTGDPDRTVRWDATLNLAKIHMQPETAVPVLMANLSPTNTFLPTTIDALRSYGGDASAAVPALLTFLSNQDQGTRVAAANAIKAIDPEAAIKARIR